jgi:P-type Cu+ transporter
MDSVNQKTSKQLAQDAVCRMIVDPRKAAGSFKYNGQTYFFCSVACLEKFQADPIRFLSSTSATPTGIQGHQETEIGKAEYTCPMHPEVRAPKTGSCTKCGMALEPATVPLSKEKIEYTCPMHPQIIRDAAGSCPICGMALEPRIPSGEEENTELVEMQRRLCSGVAGLSLSAVGSQL